MINEINQKPFFFFAKLDVQGEILRLTHKNNFIEEKQRWQLQISSF